MIRIQGIPVVTKRLEAEQGIVRKLAGLFRARAPWPRTLPPGNRHEGG